MILNITEKMHLHWYKFWMICYFLQACSRYKIMPHRYFLLNIAHLDRDSKTYSKYKLNLKIPKSWQLKTFLFEARDSENMAFKNIKASFKYPLFLKPEYGYRSIGVYYVVSDQELKNVLQKIKKYTGNYLCQTAANKKHEYDLMYVHTHDQTDEEFFACSRCCTPEGVINGVTFGTTYKNEIPKLSNQQQQQIKNHLKKIGDFGMSRISVAADSLEDVVAGKFFVIEINLLTPFPLHILDKNEHRSLKKQELKRFSVAIAKSVRHQKTRPKNQIRSLIELYQNSHHKKH